MPDTAENAFAGIWNSKRAIIAVTLILASSVLAALSIITADQWLTHTKWIFGFYATGESLTAAAQHFANAKKGDAPAAPAPADGSTPGAPA